MSLLFVKGNPWVKRSSEWDVTMGSFDGAETCELVGLFMLDQLREANIDLGLYRDDGLGVTNLKGRPLEAKRQQIQQIFRRHDLRVTITANLEATDFLDIFLDLTPRCSLVANAGGSAFCRELDIGWVHIGQWIFSISALSHELPHIVLHVSG